MSREAPPAAPGARIARMSPVASSASPRASAWRAMSASALAVRRPLSAAISAWALRSISTRARSARAEYVGLPGSERSSTSQSTNAVSQSPEVSEASAFSRSRAISWARWTRIESTAALRSSTILCASQRLMATPHASRNANCCVASTFPLW